MRPYHTFALITVAFIDVVLIEQSCDCMCFCETVNQPWIEKFILKIFLTI